MTTIHDYIRESREALHELENYSEAALDVVSVIVTALKNGNKVIICGNGGSAADAEHLAGEFLSKMYKDRPPLAAIALSPCSAVMTAIANDMNYDCVYSIQILALGKPGDVLIALSTSGNSQNVMTAAVVAKTMNIEVIGITGRSGGQLAIECEYWLSMPSDDTPIIQQCYMTLGHAIAAVVEERMFP